MSTRQCRKKHVLNRHSTLSTTFGKTSQKKNKCHASVFQIAILLLRRDVGKHKQKKRRCDLTRLLEPKTVESGAILLWGRLEYLHYQYMLWSKPCAQSHSVPAWSAASHPGCSGQNEAETIAGNYYTCLILLFHLPSDNVQREGKKTNLMLMK